MNKLLPMLIAGMTALTVFLRANASAPTAETGPAGSVSYTAEDVRNLQGFLL